MIRLLLAIIACTLTLGVGPAVADKHDTWLFFAHSVAVHRWPGVCQPISFDDVNRPIPGPWYGLARRGGNPCTVYLDSHWREWGYSFLCKVVVHEVGHLYGRGHSHNPWSIMYAYAPEILDFKPCRVTHR